VTGLLISETPSLNSVPEGIFNSQNVFGQKSPFPSTQTVILFSLRVINLFFPGRVRNETGKNNAFSTLFIKKNRQNSYKNSAEIIVPKNIFLTLILL
jgi:hypothetical protein